MMFLGSTSGPATTAIFSDLPYVLYNFRIVHENLKKGQNLPWATPLQKLVWEPEKADRLIADFEWHYKHIDKVQWRKSFSRLAGETKDKLKRREHFHGVVIEGLGVNKAILNE